MGSVVRWEKTSVHVILESQGEGEDPKELRTTSVGVVTSTNSGRAAQTAADEKEQRRALLSEIRALGKEPDGAAEATEMDEWWSA